MPQVRARPLGANLGSEKRKEEMPLGSHEGSKEGAGVKQSPSRATFELLTPIAVQPLAKPSAL